MSWHRIKLGEIAEFSNGINFSKSSYMHGVPLIGVSNFGDRIYPPYNELDEVKDEIVKANDYLQDEDIVFVRSNGNKELVGRCMLVKNPPSKITFSGFCIRCRIINKLQYNPTFMTYYFKSAGFRHSMAGTAVGANIQNLSQGKLASHIAMLPDYMTQCRIAEILSAYDDLIETNQRQIKLLEEATQRLYKEWFVDLRFPGHENVPVEDGVPEGWRQETIGDLCTKTKDVVSPEKIPIGTNYIGLEHIPRHDFCLSEWGKASDVTSSKAKYKRNDIIFGQIRPYFHKVGFALTDGVASTDSFIMTPIEGVWGLFLLTVFSDAFVDYTYQTCKEGAKMPRADWNQMKKYCINVADDKTQHMFEDRIRCIAEEIRLLALQNHNLSETRDRLLPKLMSGEIAI